MQIDQKSFWSNYAALDKRAAYLALDDLVIVIC